MQNVEAQCGELYLLSALLAMPEPESLAVLNEAAADQPWLRPAVEELAAVELEQWQAEHTGLFINGYPNTPCPPFESAYRYGLMGGEALEELTDLYWRVGIVPEGMPADYLGAMLECAGQLLERGEGPGTPLWEELWDRHLRLWLPRFCDDLANHSELVLYRALGERLQMLCDRYLPAGDKAAASHV